MWVEFVVGSRPCSERFFSGYSGFPPLLKNQHFQIPIRSGNRGPQVCQYFQVLLSVTLVEIKSIYFIFNQAFVVAVVCGIYSAILYCDRRQQTLPMHTIKGLLHPRETNRLHSYNFRPTSFHEAWCQGGALFLLIFLLEYPKYVTKVPLVW